MPFWNPWLPVASEEGEHERVPLPRAGETVQVHIEGDAHVGVYQATVRALGLRRIFLESAEAVSPYEDTDDAPALSARTPVTLSYARAESLYRCETRVVGPARPGAFAVARPRVVTRIQRRHFYRLPLQAPTTFRVQGEQSRTPALPARLVNLSGGGALLAAAKPVPGGLSVTVRVPAGKSGEPMMEVEAQSLDCRVSTQGLSRIYLVRLRFLGPPQLTEDDRDEIVAYIFEQQRLMLRTRKLLRA